MTFGLHLSRVNIALGFFGLVAIAESVGIGSRSWAACQKDALPAPPMKGSIPSRCGAPFL